MNSPNQSLGPLKQIKAVLHSEIGPVARYYGSFSDDDHEFTVGIVL